MRAALGGTLLTIGCLAALAAVVCAVGANLSPQEIHLPGNGGLPALMAAALAGWAGLAFVLGGLALRSRPKAARGLWPGLAAGFAGAVLGFGVSAYEAGRPTGRPTSPRGDDEVEVHVRGFGTVFDLAGGTRVAWTDPAGQRLRSVPEGVDAQKFLWYCGVALVYALTGGLVVGWPVAMIFRGGRPTEAADYAEGMKPESSEPAVGPATDSSARTRGH